MDAGPRLRRTFIRAAPQPFLYGLRGRMDERIDLVRSATDGRYVYLRNYLPHVSQAQHVAYQFETPTTRVWNELFVRGQDQRRPSPSSGACRKPPEELYDLETDRDEVNNLARSPEHRAILENSATLSGGTSPRSRTSASFPSSNCTRAPPSGSPYDLCVRSTEIRSREILATAELASNFDPAAVPARHELLTDRDSAVRYWAALGLLMRGEKGPRRTASAWNRLWRQFSRRPHRCRSGACRVRRRSGALEALELSAPSRSPKNGVLVSMSALAAIEALGPTAASLHDQIGGSNPDGPTPRRPLQQLCAALDRQPCAECQSRTRVGQGQRQGQAWG